MVPILDRSWVEDNARKYNEAPEHLKERPVEVRIRKAMEDSPSELTTSTLMDIELWKWGRRRGLVAENEEEFAKEVSRISFASKDNRLKLGVLTLLKGVGFRMAATILAFRYPTQFSVFDWRAWESLKAFGKVEGEIEDTLECWQSYNRVCGETAKQLGVSLRELDKALWYYKGGKK